MVQLRLVAGTDFCASKKSPSAPRGFDTDDVEAKAREIIRGFKPGFEGLRVSDLLDAMNKGMGEGEAFMPYIQRRGDIRSVLLRAGITCWSAHAYDDLDVSIFGLVTHEKRLLKALPELKPFKGKLEGLTF